MNKRFALTSIFALSILSACSKEPEDDLTYKGATLDPNCFHNLIGDDLPPTLDLDKCTRDDPKIKAQINRADNSVSYDYGPSENNLSGREMVEYKFIGKLNGQSVLHVTDNGGGSGYFDSVYSVKREGNILKLSSLPIPGGDRCNGGISDVSIKDNKINYSAKITPVDFITLAGDDSKVDLEYSAVSCFGEANYEDNKLVSISFDDGSGPAQDQAGWTENYKDQSCFNKVYNSYLKPALSDQELIDKTPGYRVTLSVDELKQFIAKFKEQCKP